MSPAIPSISYIASPFLSSLPQSLVPCLPSHPSGPMMMKIFAVVICFLVSIQSAWLLCSGDELKKVEAEVVGLVDCFDCAAKKIFPHEAFSGIGVTIDCKGADRLSQTRGVGLLNGEGQFRVLLPDEMLLENGTLKEECFVHLHSASAAPCPLVDGIEAARIVLQSKVGEMHTFGPAGELKLSPAICASTFSSLPHFRHPNIPWFLTWMKFPPFAKHHYMLSDYFPRPLKKREKPIIPKIPILRRPLPFPAPNPRSQKHLPAPTLKPGLLVKKHVPAAATPVVWKTLSTLLIPKRLHPMAKLPPLRHVRIPRLGLLTHP